MRHSLKEPTTVSNIQLLLAYVADLELEVDRLPKQGQFIQHEARGALKRIHLLCTDAAVAGDAQPVLGAVGHVAKQLMTVLRDLHEPPGYHSAHDQVTAIAVRPLVEQVFRWQQRLEGATQVVLHLELESEHVEWFPARLRAAPARAAGLGVGLSVVKMLVEQSGGGP